MEHHASQPGIDLPTYSSLFTCHIIFQRVVLLFQFQFSSQFPLNDSMYLGLPCQGCCCVAYLLKVGRVKQILRE